MRNITSHIFADEFFGALKPTHRLLWLGMVIALADDQGRMTDNAALMRSLLFPYDNDVTIKDIEKGLAFFESKHKIARYAVGTNGSSKRLIQIVNWWKYQKSAQWAARSIHPAPLNWMDRIRVHVKGGGIDTTGWENDGGYEGATKAQAKSKVAATKAQAGREVKDEVKDDVKGRAGGVPELIKGAPKKEKAPLPLPPNFGKGKPKGFANLEKVKHGNR